MLCLMKLGLQLGYWGAQPPQGVGELVTAAEDAGFDAIFSAEAWGSDAFTPLAWWGRETSRVRLGTSIVQMSGRTPTSIAMHALTLDHLSHGRVVLGIGVSGPQVVEGWYGQPFAKPLARTREYISIVRDIVARRDRVTAPGPHYPLPYPDGTGLGKPLKSTLHPVREEIPIFLGAEGPKNVALAGELCDGWLALFFSPRHAAFYRDALAEGFAREGARRSFDDFEVAASVPLIVHDDVEQAADMLRPMYALYFGGMGARGRNFHHDVAVRMGYADEAKKIQDLYLDGKKGDAAAAVPTKLVEDLALIGPADKVRGDLEAWRESIATTLLIGGDAAIVRQAAELVLG